MYYFQKFNITFYNMSTQLIPNIFRVIFEKFFRQMISAMLARYLEPRGSELACRGHEERDVPGEGGG